MKILFLALLTLIHFKVGATTHQSLLNLDYTCTYSHVEEDNDDEEFITIDIQISRGQIVYSSSDLTRLIYAPVTNTVVKNKKILIEGTLPSPWSAGSRFRIQLQDDEENPIYKIKFIVPDVGPLKATKMSCVKKLN